MKGIDPKAFEFALSRIEDGSIFEDFAQIFLNRVLGHEFIPAGGLKDRGIDGLEHVFHRKGFERYIYQISIEKGCEAKLSKTLLTLVKNGIEFDKLYYVTNQPFPEKDTFTDRMYDIYQKPVQIYDVKWFSTNVNESEKTISAYYTFVSSYLHEYNQPGKSIEIADLVGDPRLFVFLRQQWEENKDNGNLDEILANTLILFCLEGTDPDKGLFKTSEEIKESIAKYIKFDPKLLYPVIEKQLRALSTKPRQIKYHTKAQAYCLPYETRLLIQQRNIEDVALHEAFILASEKKLRRYLKDAEIRVRDCTQLLEETIHEVYYQQGLEFADFVLHGESKEAFEKNLPEIIDKVVSQSRVILKNKGEVSSSLLMTIRDIIYNGTREQKEYLRRLSNTYMMLFLLQCDPKLATYFHTMASRLNVYVCTSIIIPALSEYYLDPVNRRHWNLLKGANNAGVTLTINEIIVDEILSHFRSLIRKYEDEYKHHEELYLGDELQTLYIDEIMLRAYFYAKARGKVRDFYDFINSFVTPDLRNGEIEIIEWLKEEFGVRYTSNQSLGFKLNPQEVTLLSEHLAEQKKSIAKAKADTNIILTIHALRERNNETYEGGIFGYKTWWLSKDITTQMAVNRVFVDKYKTSCYIRPDFLYNYISLAPSKAEVATTYREIFPSMLGVNIGFNLPESVTNFIHKTISEHKGKNPVRLKAMLRSLTEDLKTNPNHRTRRYVKNYFDEVLKDLTNPNK